ncbi:TELO2-interacting protein 1 homolog isoform X2 [Entelurus aequoreus]|uniref:TELO2-interacting protein 1 homolog isoform X2 n=1 Tax=Entelurus aequoreus TaxID=161455 RepID=UPI002B1D5E22|nr:TELO2-interacting protein 1 homolog isoform X2 [Entelurus aequoreus]
MHTFEATQQEVMPQIGDPKMAFAHLRPGCVLLSRQPTLHNVETLSGQLKEVEHATLQQLQDYVLFPLRLVLKGGGGAKKEKVVQAVVETMTQVLEKTCVQSWETLRQLFSELCLCLCSPCDPGKPADTSEELKLAVLRCLDALLHAAYGDIVFKLFQAAMLPGLGAAVSLLLALAEKDTCREVQAAALKSLQALTMQCDCSQDHVVPCSEEREALGASFASFLPGIASSVARMVTGDVRQGHAVTVRAIKVWSRTVSLVMEDAQLQSIEPQKSSRAHLSKLEQLMVHRTLDWVKKTSERLCVLLKRIISSTVAHQHWRVRLEVLELADHLLDRCGGSLGQCVGLLLEVLVGAVNDVDLRVRERCELALRAASQTIQMSSKTKDTESKSSFTDVLSENLHSLATSLPRLMRTYDDQKKLFVLNVLLGYLKLLGPLVSVVLNSAVHLHRISKALMQVLDLDVTDVRIVEERGHGALIGTGSGSLHCADVRRKRFLFFTDDTIFSVLTEICQTLGYYGNIYLLTDHFLDLYRQSSVYRKQAAMVLNQIIRGAAEGRSSASQEDLKASVMLVLEEYISPNNWHVNMVAEDSGSHGKDQKVKNNWHVNMVAEDSGSHGQDQKPSSSSMATLRQLNSNIWQVCIQLEGVACLAQALGRDFRPLLMTSLYPVLEKAGEETLLIGQAALNAMWAISEACGYSSLKDMIAENSDYLLNDISLNLQRLGQHPQAPGVLTVMLRHSDCSLLPLVADLLHDVLMALDLNYQHMAATFCSVLYSLMTSLAKWFPSSCNRTKKSCRSQQNSADQEVFDVRLFLLDYRKQKDLAEGLGMGQDDLDEEDYDGGGPEEKPDLPLSPPPAEEEDDYDGGGAEEKADLPLHLSMSKEVMERCIHLLSDSSLQLRLKVLDVLQLCISVLAKREDDLLPLAHRCWPPLLQRLTADDPPVVLQAFRVLCTLAASCGDFLRSRVSKELVPKLSSWLTQQAGISAQATPVYCQSLAYKMQLLLLEGLGPLCQSLDLAEADLHAVSEACLPYLSCRQPVRLQQACLRCFQKMIQVDPDTLWLTLTELHCYLPHPPHPHLHPLQLRGRGRPRDEYSDNVLHLLREDFDH